MVFIDYLYDKFVSYTSTVFLYIIQSYFQSEVRNSTSILRELELINQHLLPVIITPNMMPCNKNNCIYIYHTANCPEMLCHLSTKQNDTFSNGNVSVTSVLAMASSPRHAKVLLLEAYRLPKRSTFGNSSTLITEPMPLSITPSSPNQRLWDG